jgi:nucleoside-diphosphate-sugar epimerase
MASALRAGARVVVTGAAGRHGRVVTALLVKRGFDVLATDVAPWPACPARFVQAELGCDGAAVAELLRGAAGVVHLAAVPGPSATPPPHVDPAWSGSARLGLEALSPGEVLARNSASSWAVFNTAARAGVPRLVFSSSAFTQGWSHDPRAFAPPQLPLSEAAEPTPYESYGLSKLAGEAALACVVRAAARTPRPLSAASLRFTNLVYPEDEHRLPWAAPSEEAPQHALMWCFSKAHEVALAHVLALEAPREALGASGHEAFLLAAPTTRFVEDTVPLLRRFFPTARLDEAKLRGNSSLICTRKAQERLGWLPSTVAALRQARPARSG